MGMGSEDTLTQTSTVEPDVCWVRRRTEIRLTLGELALGTIQFQAAVLPDARWRTATEVTEGDIATELRSGVDAVCLKSLPTAEHLPRIRFQRNAMRYVPTHFKRHYVVITGSFPEYVKQLSAKLRKNVTRSVRKFADAGGGSVDFREYRRPAEMADFFEVASQVSIKTYQHKLLKAGLPQTAEFRRKIVELAAEDRVRGYLLYLNGSPVAFAYCTVDGELLTYQTPGYDPAYGVYSPGIVLLYHILDRVISEGLVRVFDFGTGDAFYKDAFATGTAACAAVYYFRYNPKTLVFVAVHTSLCLLSAAAVKLLKALHVKDLAKKIFRRAA